MTLDHRQREFSRVPGNIPYEPVRGERPYQYWTTPDPTRLLGTRIFWWGPVYLSHRQRLREPFDLEGLDAVLGVTAEAKPLTRATRFMYFVHGKVHTVARYEYGVPLGADTMAPGEKPISVTIEVHEGMLMDPFREYPLRRIGLGDFGVRAALKEFWGNQKDLDQAERATIWLRSIFSDVPGVGMVRE